MLAKPVPELVLYCPRCGYNLTGLTVDRCPECGRHFDRPALESELSAPAKPVSFREVAAPLILVPIVACALLTAGLKRCGLDLLFAAILFVPVGMMTACCVLANRVAKRCAFNARKGLDSGFCRFLLVGFRILFLGLQLALILGGMMVIGRLTDFPECMP